MWKNCLIMKKLKSFNIFPRRIFSDKIQSGAHMQKSNQVPICKNQFMCRHANTENSFVRRCSRISIFRILDKLNSRCLEQNKWAVPSLSIYAKWLLDKSNSRCLEQICWSLDSSRYRERLYVRKWKLTY